MGDFIKSTGHGANFAVGQDRRTFRANGAIALLNTVRIDLTDTTFGIGNSVVATSADDDPRTAGVALQAAAAAGDIIEVCIHGLVTGIAYDAAAAPTAGQMVASDLGTLGVKAAASPTVALQPMGLCYAIDTAAVTADVFVDCRGRFSESG